MQASRFMTVLSKTARLKMEELLDCPFCAFTDHDPFFLLQHVETVHPEGGRPSPFAVRESLTHQVEPPAGEMEGIRDNSSGYIECQCGEFCLLTEFESHLEMHYAEGFGADEFLLSSAEAAALKFTLRPSKTSSSQVELPSTTPSHVVVSHPGRSGSNRSVLDPPLHRRSSRKSGSSVRDLIGVLCRSTSSPSSQHPQAARNRVPRRLGVCESICVTLNTFTDGSNRELNWALMLTKKRCRTGYAGSLR